MVIELVKKSELVSLSTLVHCATSSQLFDLCRAKWNSRHLAGISLQPPGTSDNTQLMGVGSRKDCSAQTLRTCLAVALVRGKGSFTDFTRNEFSPNFLTQTSALLCENLWSMSPNFNPVAAPWFLDIWVDLVSLHTLLGLFARVSRCLSRCYADA